jgi:hypothetical protein
VRRSSYGQVVSDIISFIQSWSRKSEFFGNVATTSLSAEPSKLKSVVTGGGSR